MPNRRAIDGLSEKLNRADSQIDALHRQIDAFIDEQPYSTRMEDDKHLANVKNLVVSVARETPVGWSIVVGEICHDLRSALDQLIGLVSDEPDGRSAFPIYRSPTLYEQRGRGGAAIRLVGVPALAQARIKALQPFRVGGQGNPLWITHELNRLDKHKSLVLALARFELHAIHLLKPFEQRKILEPPTLVHDGTADVGTDIHWFRLLRHDASDGNEAVDAEVRFEFTASVAFVDAGPASDLPVVETLRVCSRFVRKVITNLSRFIPEQHVTADAGR